VSDIHNIDFKQLTSPFAAGCDNQWLTQSELGQGVLTSALTSWLFDRGSLTSRLKDHCHDFSVVVLNSGAGAISAQEQLLFPAIEMPLHCREVLLLCDGIPQVYARSLIVKQALEHSAIGLKQLGNNSLGQVLFQAPQAQRGSIEVSQFSCQSSVATLARELNLSPTQPLWGRRSIFTLQQYPLLVSEMFLPGALAYQEEHHDH